MKNPPANWTRISSALYYEDPAKAIDWLCRAFGFEVRLKVDGPNGRVEHSELVFGGGLIMVGGVGPDYQDKADYRAAPPMVGGRCTQNLMVYVDDVDAHCARARAAGAVIDKELTNTDYGPEYWEDRGYACTDPGGHHWWFYQRLRDPQTK